MLQNYSCSLCNSEVPCIGCICDGDIKLIGPNCKTIHLQDTSSLHESIDISLALKLQSNFDLYEEYMNSTMKTSEVMNKLLVLKTRIQAHKLKLKQDREKLMGSIDEVFEQALGRYERSLEEIKDKMRALTSYKRTLCKRGKEILDNYNIQGEASITTGDMKRIVVPVEEIIDNIRESILENDDYMQRNKRIRRDNDECQDDNMMVSYYKLLTDDQSCKIKKLTLALSKYQLEASVKNTTISQLFQKLKIYREALQPIKHDLLHLKSDILMAISDNMNKISIDLRAITSDYSTSPSTSPGSIPSPRSLSIISSPSSSFTVNLPSSQYLYTVSQEGKGLIQYDLTSNTLSLINTKKLKSAKENINLCTIPHGKLLLLVYQTIRRLKNYLVDTSTGKYSVRNSMPDPRPCFSTCYHDGYVYLFGGTSKRKQYRDAYRYSLVYDSWERLHDMKYAREYLAPIVIENKIYLFAGGYDRIEIFDIKTKTFGQSRFKNEECIENMYGVVNVVEDRIYLVTNQFVQVYDKMLNKLHSKALGYHRDHITSGNLVIQNGKIYSYNSSVSAIECLDVSNYYKNVNISKNPACYLYKLHPKNDQLHRINITDATIEVFEFGKARFKNTSMCLINSNLVFMTGFRNRIRPVCYIYDALKNQLFKVQNMITGRGRIGLIYCDGCIYAFGGKNVNILKYAEKFNLHIGEWVELDDMNLPRKLPSCVRSRDFIYVIGGGQTNIEIYEIYTGSFRVCEVDLIDRYGVVGEIESRIYYIGSKGYQIFDAELREMGRGEIPRGSDVTYCMGNVIIDQGKIYYYNHWSESIETFDIRSFTKGILPLRII